MPDPGALLSHPGCPFPSCPESSCTLPLSYCPKSLQAQFSPPWLPEASSIVEPYAVFTLRLVGSGVSTGGEAVEMNMEELSQRVPLTGGGQSSHYSHHPHPSLEKFLAPAPVSSAALLLGCWSPAPDLPSS